MSDQEQIDKIGMGLGINTNTRKWVEFRDAVINLFEQRDRSEIAELRQENIKLKAKLTQKNLFQ